MKILPNSEHKAQQPADCPTSPFDNPRTLPTATRELADRLKPLTTRELAARLSVSTRTVQAWRDQGRLPHVRITARSFRYFWEQIERSLAKGGK